MTCKCVLYISFSLLEGQSWKKESKIILVFWSLLRICCVNLLNF